MLALDLSALVLWTQSEKALVPILSVRSLHDFLVHVLVFTINHNDNSLFKIATKKKLHIKKNKNSPNSFHM